MARPPRNDHPGSWHHVMNRGIRRYPLYSDDDDRRLFIELLYRHAETEGAEVAAHCLMGNHYHAVIFCPSGGVSVVIQRSMSSYVRKFNARHGHDGTLFRGRFVSKLIVDDAQALATTRYVHRNPLELGISIDDYPWSTYADFLRQPVVGRARRLILALAGGPSGYRSFVERRQLADRFAVSDGVRSIAPRPSSVASLDQLKNAAQTCGGPPAVVRSASVLLSVDVVQVGATLIAAEFGLPSAAAVHSAASRARKKVVRDPAFAAVVDEIRRRLHAA